MNKWISMAHIPDITQSEYTDTWKFRPLEKGDEMDDSTLTTTCTEGVPVLEQETCEGCRYFTGEDQGQGTGVGLCRFSAPAMSGWPIVEELEWCGDFEVSE